MLVSSQGWPALCFYETTYKRREKDVPWVQKIYPLTFEYFNRSTSAAGGFRYECKPCKNVRNKTLPSYIDKQNRQNRKTLSWKFNSYKQNAKDRGRDFKITKEEFGEFWQRSCSYCGTPIETIGLDRKDDSKGYILENLISCCGTCNYMKGYRLTEKEFIEQCKRVAKNN